MSLIDVTDEAAGRHWHQTLPLGPSGERESQSKSIEKASSAIRAGRAHEATSRASWIANQVAFLLANVAICTAELYDPTIERSLLIKWAAAAALNLIVRAFLSSFLCGASIQDIRMSRVLSAIPVIVTAVAIGHWLWSVQLFVNSDEFTNTSAVVFIVFVMLSIATMGNWLQAPIASMSYVVVLWLALSMRAETVGLLSVNLLLTINACVAVMVMTSAYSLYRLGPLLDRSDQADRLVIEMKRANARLEAMKDEAASTLEKRSSFFAGASHDLKQRLHAMKLMAFSTIVDLPMDDERRWALGRLSEEVEELEAYFKHVLEFARMEALDPVAQACPVQLQKILQHVDLNFEHVAIAQEIKLTFRPTTLRVITDPVMLQRMLENLVSNALKFTRGGVLVAARKRRGFVLLEVWDQGPGLSEEATAKIFDAFHQDGSQATGEERGVGLGLAVVKRFADCLGCHVSVDSRIGRGTVFRLKLPQHRS